MKKILYLALIIFLFYPRSNATMTEIDPDYKIYYLKADNISTDNFASYFSDIEVIGIYPKIRKVLQDKLNEYKYYKFNFYSSKKNIDEFKEIFIKKVTEKGYLSEAHNLEMNGIDIDTIKVYSKLDILKEKFKNFEYCLTFDSLCHKI